MDEDREVVRVRHDFQERHGIFLLRVPRVHGNREGTQAGVAEEIVRVKRTKVQDRLDPHGLEFGNPFDGELGAAIERIGHPEQVRQAGFLERDGPRGRSWNRLGNRGLRGCHGRGNAYRAERKAKADRPPHAFNPSCPWGYPSPAADPRGTALMPRTLSEYSWIARSELKPHHIRDVHDAHARPLVVVAVRPVHGGLAVQVRVEVREVEVTVAPVQQGVPDRPVEVRLVEVEEAAVDVVEHALDVRVLVVHVPRVVRAAHRVELLDRFAEQEEVVRPDGLADLDVRAVERADGQRAVQGELHIARTVASVPAVEICSLKSPAGMMRSASETR